jgi:hypothetical protein
VREGSRRSCHVFKIFDEIGCKSLKGKGFLFYEEMHEC